jgi:hypothetical protein
LPDPISSVTVDISVDYANSALNNVPDSTTDAITLNPVWNDGPNGDIPAGATGTWPDNIQNVDTVVSATVGELWYQVNLPPYNCDLVPG